MTDRPILFSAPMVRALLAGTKTQTRRIVNPQPELLPNGLWHVHNRAGGLVGVAEEDIGREQVDYLRIAVGDRLYVREAWRPGYNAEGWREDLGRVARPSDFDPATTAIEYLADGTNELGGDNRPSIHMPRWASRITLHVTDVRVQRLGDISDEDAKAEGIVCVGRYQEADSIASDPLVGHSDEEAWSHDPKDRTPVYELPGSAKGAYRRLWNSINGPESWDTNPWVAAYTFTVERANIDQAREVDNG